MSSHDRDTTDTVLSRRRLYTGQCASSATSPCGPHGFRFPRSCDTGLCPCRKNKLELLHFRPSTAPPNCTRTTAGQSQIVGPHHVIPTYHRHELARLTDRSLIPNFLAIAAFPVVLLSSTL